MSKLTEEQFEAYLKQIRELVEGPLEEMQPEIEVTNKFPQEFYDLAIKNDLYRFALPSQYGGWDLSELDILRVQEEFSRGPGGMRMHLHKYGSIDDCQTTTCHKNGNMGNKRQAQPCPDPRF